MLMVEVELKWKIGDLVGQEGESISAANKMIIKGEIMAGHCLVKYD